MKNARNKKADMEFTGQFIKEKVIPLRLYNPERVAKEVVGDLSDTIARIKKLDAMKPGIFGKYMEVLRNEGGEFTDWFAGASV